ncbi:MAG: NIPSNAP family protein, partial [Flavisolibacter sp.]|nr:NIPSNAP family protein [Flavisolibacter sp.]
HFEKEAQEKVLHEYLENALLPALHRLKIYNIGVFSAITNDTAKLKSLYVLIPFRNWDAIEKLASKLSADLRYQVAGTTYINSYTQSPPYTRMERILLRDFSGAPAMQLPKLIPDRNERVYELRSYESVTEKIFQNKMHMFIEGGETEIFNRLHFNPVFYGEVLAGSKMPNLMYLTSFENMADRGAHWKSFGNDPAWKKLSAMPFYQDNVSHIDIILLHPTAYSDY